MGSFSIWHWLVVGIIILLLFGKGRFSEMMGDVAKGLKSFKKGMSEDDEAKEQRRLEGQGKTLQTPADRPTTLEVPREQSRGAERDERREP
jgi:sec-independent protein translocase protein TatA